MRSSLLVRVSVTLLVTLLTIQTRTVEAAGRLACGVCEALVDEVNAGIAATPTQHSVQTRFRIDEKKRVPFSRTEYNLLEIMEADDFPTKFEKYGLVRPWTKTAKHMKRAYTLLAEGKEIEAIVAEAPKKKEEAAPAAAATPATDAAAATPSVDGTAAPATDAAPAAPAEPELPLYVPFRPRGSLPLSLQHNHFHLVESKLASTTGLHIESTSSILSEIKQELDEFLEEYLDEAMLMFHRDVPDIKQKLCVQVTEACAPKKKKAKKTEEAKKAAEEAQPKKDEL